MLLLYASNDVILMCLCLWGLPVVDDVVLCCLESLRIAEKNHPCNQILGFTKKYLHSGRDIASGVQQVPKQPARLSGPPDDLVSTYAVAIVCYCYAIELP